MKKGEKYGKLTAISFVEKRKNNSYWNFECVCGKIKCIRASHVEYGFIKSCGCLRKKGRIWTQEQKRKKSKAMKGKVLTMEHRKNLSLSLKGRDTWNKGTGYKSSINKKVRKCLEFKKWREAVFARDNWTCQKCGKRGGILNPHHIIYLSVLINKYKIKNIFDAGSCGKLWRLENGVTLCDNCHQKEHKNIFVWNK